MAITKEDLRDFTCFASEKLENGGIESLVALANEWQAKREMQETVSDIRLSHEDIEAGRTSAVNDAFADVRKELARHSSFENGVIHVDPEAVRELAKFFPDVLDSERLKRELEGRGGVTTAEMLGKAMRRA
jgi:hypothetical protein